MKELNCKELKAIEIEKSDLLEVNGGYVAYLFPTNTQDSDNEYIMTFCYLYNIAASIRNWFGD